MRLYSVTFNGYKRFADTWINLDGRTIAIVGPNEAGKSSLLDALLILNDDSPVPTTALTRGVVLGADSEVVWARFRLTEEERKLSPLPLADNEAIWLIVAKSVAGQRRFRVVPAPRRDRRPRERAARALRRAVGDPWFRAWERSAAGEPSDDTGGLSGASIVRALPDDLDPKPHTLAPDLLDRSARVRKDLQALIDNGVVSSRAGRQGVARLDATLADLERVEGAPHPNTLAERLQSRVPRFVDFDEQQRDLRSEYDLADGGEISSPPLRNLATMAALPLEALRDAITSGDSGRRRSLQEGAQRRLGAELREAWRQAPLTVSFDRDGTVMRITVSSHEDEYFSLHDRSDGMRMFLALRSFLAQQQYETPPILLVDEAETHLHYDAQADLIRVLEQQSDVAQVIYTTHSIGCLPQDLGRGVRVVSPIPGSTRSSVENVWCREGAGVSPLMLAMGASTVPLAPSRFVVIAEGPSDAMLLPSILREATGLPSLEFQIVAGLSEASDAELSRLDAEAPRVAYLLDGDQGGAEIALRLRKLRIEPRKIVRLSGSAMGIVIEDLLEPDLYVDAVNQYLHQWPPHRGGFRRSDLSRTGRPQSVAAWCNRNAVAVPSKLRIAEEVLRILDDPEPEAERRVADTTRRALLRTVHGRLRRALGEPVAAAETQPSGD